YRLVASEMNVEAQLQRAFLLWQQKRFADADSMCREVLARAPLDPQALHLAGLIRRQLGDVADAERSLRQSIQLQPSRAECHANLGNLLRAQGRLHEARASYERAVSLDPEHRMSRLGLARLLSELGEHAAAAVHGR